MDTLNHTINQNIEKFKEEKIKKFGKGNVIIKEDKILVARIGRYLPNIYIVYDIKNICEDKNEEIYYGTDSIDFSFVVGSFYIDEFKKCFRPMTKFEIDPYLSSDTDEISVLMRLSNKLLIQEISPKNILYKKICMKKEKFKVYWAIITFKEFKRLIHKGVFNK